MTHLEILAARLDNLARMAAEQATKYGNEKSVFLRGHYGGEVIAFGMAADMLRTEALKRAGIDKPAPIVGKLRDARELVRKARSSEEVSG